MSVKKLDLLAYIEETQPVNQKTIQEHFGFKDATTVSQRMKYMEKKGEIKREEVRLGQSTHKFVMLPDYPYTAWFEFKLRLTNPELEKSQLEKISQLEKKHEGHHEISQLEKKKHEECTEAIQVSQLEKNSQLEKIEKIDPVIIDEDFYLESKPSKIIRDALPIKNLTPSKQISTKCIDANKVLKLLRNELKKSDFPAFQSLFDRAISKNRTYPLVPVIPFLNELLRRGFDIYQEGI